MCCCCCLLDFLRDNNGEYAEATDVGDYLCIEGEIRFYVYVNESLNMSRFILKITCES